MFILEKQTANTAGEWVNLPAAFDRRKNPMIVTEGPFDGATLTVHVRPIGSDKDGATTDELTFTGPDALKFPLAERMQIKPAVTNAGASTSINLWVG